MSTRRTVTEASMREYAAAEERLLDLFSPLSDTVQAPGSDTAQPNDPSKDNMLQLISDDSDIRSLLASADSIDFKGFYDGCQDYDDEVADTRETGSQPLIFGTFRNADNLMDCPTTAKESRRTPPLITSAPIALLEAGTSAGFMLTNGNVNGNEEADQANEEQLTIDSQNVIDESHGDCAIYDDDNVVLLSDDNCCEIIVSAHGVHTEHEMERAYLMGLQPVPEQLNNGTSYGSDLCPAGEEEEPPNMPHVYLSDAALDPQQQQLMLDAAEEEAHQVSDSYADNRADICEVYDHELEDHDDESAVNEQLQLQQVDIEQQHLAISNAVEELQQQQPCNASNVEELQETQAAATAAIPHSSTTEFPVSSTSMPNGSDYDDYDDELGTAEDRSPPVQRKYVPLLKNTLSAEALDRRLAYIRQTQPQMSLAEKLAIWNCAHSCEAVEDVENFESVFEQHEAEPAKQPKFNEFCELLRQSLATMTNAIQESSAGDAHHAAVAPDTPYSSEHAARQKRPCFRRLLHTMPPAQQTEPIVVDDDDEDDDDCFEVVMNPSSMTLVPKLHGKAEQKETHLKTTQTQTNLPLLLVTKETSTTDLTRNRVPPSEPTESNEVDQTAPDVQHKSELQRVDSDSLKHMLDHLDQQQQEQEYQRLPPTGNSRAVRANSVECQNDAQFYEQHEFCNYLGLTGLETANAVANAMRELASSTVARRSLRVRTQQQLNRMRSDVRGRRRVREQQQQQQEQQQHEQQQQLEQQQLEQQQEQEQQDLQLLDKSDQQLNSDASSICSNNSSTKKTVGSCRSAAPANSSTFIYPRPAAISTVPITGPTVEYYYRAQVADEQEPQHSNTMVVANDYHAMSLEAAFARVYAAAAPAQKELHESIQSRLRQARETKPSIYIVQSLNNPTINRRTASPANASPERQQHSQKSEQAAAAAPKPPRKTTKKPAPKASQRRRTTAGGLTATAPPDRELVTRATTHMNSKLLRNRKVSLLKSYELTDTTALRRNKQRLSGGSTSTAGKRLNAPKALKKSLKQMTEVVISHATSQPSRVDPPSSPAKPKKTRPQPIEQKAATKRKRLRAKSLPLPLDTERQAAGTGDGNADEAKAEMRHVQESQMLLDTHKFITNQATVSPPLYSSAMRRYVNAVYQPKEQQPLEPVPEVPQSPVGFLDLSGAYAKLPKPAFVYPPLSPPPSQRAPHFSRRARQMAGTTSGGAAVPDIQLTQPGGLLSLTKGSTALRNPLAGRNGKVLYIYYELEQLIVLQEKLVSFWKYSKIFNVLNKATAEEENATGNQQHAFNAFTTNSSQNTRKISADSDKSNEDPQMRWIHLGGTRRITNDIEIATPHCNRLCAHNSTPVYVEMRSHPLEHHKRESKLLSLYVNVYYYCDEELRPKMHSVHLDAVNCDWNQVIYTSIAESRYFVMAWQQELLVGRPRAGICKYSLTPTLDTLASIREFKQLRHELIHIECLTEDRLIGYGQTRITIWDHRSGDTLMNYDFNFSLGHNLGVMNFPSFDIDQSNLLVLYQHVMESNKWPELRIIACELSHATPSHRVLHVHRLPSPQFDCHLVAINTGDHLILKSPNDDEIWISTSDPRQLTYLAPQNNQRFYTRQKSQIITVTPNTLVVDSIANHVLKLAAEHQQNIMMQAMNMVASTANQLPVSV